MREKHEERFRFRVWSEEEKKWCDGLFIDGLGCVGVEWFWDGGGVDCRDNANGNRRFAVEQCTGLRDANGRLIYEGDIIESFANECESVRNVVEWNGDFTRFEAVPVPKYEWTNNCGSISKEWLARFERRIVGNIHENPELLETKK